MLQKVSVVTLEVSLFKQPGACMAVVMVVLPTCRGSCATAGSKLGLWKAIIETHNCLPGLGTALTLGLDMAVVKVL